MRRLIGVRVPGRARDGRRVKRKEGVREGEAMSIKYKNIKKHIDFYDYKFYDYKYENRCTTTKHLFIM